MPPRSGPWDSLPPVFLRLMSARKSQDVTSDLLTVGGMAWRTRWVPLLAKAAFQYPTEGGRCWAIQILYFLCPPSRSASAVVRAILPLIEDSDGRPPAQVGRTAEIVGPLVPDLDGRTSLAHRAVQSLGRLLTHPYPDVRADAVYALGNIPGRTSAAFLRLAERDKAEFWGGRVGTYAKRWREVCEGDRMLRFRYRMKREPGYRKRDDGP